MNSTVFVSFFIIPLSHIYDLKKNLPMSSPLTPFQLPTAMSLGSYDTSEAPHAGTSLLDDISTPSMDFSSGLHTPFNQSLLSPFGTFSPTPNTFNASIGPMGNEKGAYSRLLQQNSLMRNDLLNKKQEIDELK